VNRASAKVKIVTRANAAKPNYFELSSVDEKLQSEALLPHHRTEHRCSLFFLVAASFQWEKMRKKTFDSPVKFLIGSICHFMLTVRAEQPRTHHSIFKTPLGFEFYYSNEIS
jgi:hypothetical protein